MIDSRNNDQQSWRETDDDYVTLSSAPGEGSTEFLDENDDEATKRLAKAEEAAAPQNSLRIFMVIILVVVTFFGVLGIYSFGRAIERDEFNAGLASIAHRIESGCNANAQRKLDTLHAVADLFATHVQDTQSMQWPFVSLQRPYQHLEIHRKSAGFDAVFFMPIVSQVDRVSWERYSYQHSGWLTGDQFETKDSPVSLFIKDKEGQDKSAGPYVPQWQYSPLIENRGALNFNWRALDGFAEEFPSIQAGSSSISHVWTFDPALNSPSMVASVPFQFLTDLLESQAEYSIGEPVSFLSTPM